MSKHDTQDMEAAATYKEHTPTLAEQINDTQNRQRRAEQLSKATDEANRAYSSAVNDKCNAEEKLWKMLCEQLNIDTQRMQWDIAEVREVVMAAVALAAVK